MARPITTLTIFFVVMNLWAGVMLSTGFAGTLGIDATVGEDDAVNDTVDQAGTVDSGSSTGRTLFGMYNVLAGQVGSILSTVFPGLRMLERAGTPQYITQGIFGPLFSLMIGITTISLLRGWDL